MIDGLAAIHVTGVELPLMDFKFDSKNRDFLEQNLNQFDYVIIPSPTVIDYLKDIIGLANRPTFITVGRASAAKISKLTHKEVIYPSLGAGGLALFNEKLSELDLPSKMVLVIKGDGGNDALYLHMAKHNIKWTTIDIYKRIMLELEPDYLKKMLLIDGLQGIIITSSGLVDWLFEQASKANCVELLKNCLFLTIHTQIEKKLISLGALKVLVTERTERNSIIELIRGMI
jgi:uroporphyrinogen-III synthase